MVGRKLQLILLWCMILVPLLAGAGSLTDFQGKQRSLQDYTGGGKWLVVMIWASDCPICNKEVASYVAFNEKHRTSDAMVLGVSMDGAGGKQDAEAFIKRHGVSFTNLIGEPGDVAALYSKLTGRPWVGTPTFLVYAPDGEISAQQVGAVPVALIEQHIAGN